MGSNGLWGSSANASGREGRRRGLRVKTTHYEETHGTCSLQGVGLDECDALAKFLAGAVADRLHDEGGLTDFHVHLNGLATTGFAREGLQELLAAAEVEEKSWAVGEALAEAWLTLEHGIDWPWNMAADKRTPKASLPGPDLIGFLTIDGGVRLVLGEVKSSTDAGVPPGVMTGRAGMTHQLEALAQNKSLLYTILRWLHCRCKEGKNLALFNGAVKTLLDSKHKNVALFGVLVRDTQPNHMDLRNRGIHLSGVVSEPGNCILVALYLPCPLAELPERCPMKVAA